MAGEAQQLSFMQGEISPEFYYRSDLASFNSSVSKASNVRLGPLGGLSNRKGSRVEQLPASADIKITTLTSSNDYVTCVFHHYITKQLFFLEVFNNAGEIKVYCGGVLMNTEIFGFHNIPEALDIRGDILTGLAGLHFVIHNDAIIFSKTLPIRVLNVDIVGYEQYVQPIDETYSYTETQFCIRMVPPDYVGSDPSKMNGLRLESNFTLQSSNNATVPYTYSAKSTYVAPVTGNASYAIVSETADGVDSSMSIMNSIAGVNMALLPSGSVDDVIPYPNTTVTNVLSIASVGPEIISFGGKVITKLKVYRATGKHDGYNGLYKLVAKFGVDEALAISVTDKGQDEAAYTVCSDTSALYKQPSFLTLSTTLLANTLTGGLKTVVDTTVFQQRAYYAINKGLWWGTSVYNNTIVASRVGALSQVIYPQISNPSEAFQFNVPEDKGGYLTHLASLSRLVAFTNTSTFVIQGDEAGIITPTSINPYKVLSFGCREGVPPAVSGETCIFAASGGGVGYLSVTADGSIVAGNASALAGHMFENKTILSIIPLLDRKTLPVFLINTTEGDVYECYKVGEFFAFFRVNMLGIPSNGTITDGGIFPSTQVMSPAFTGHSLGAEAYVNYRMWNSTLGKHYVNSVALSPEPVVSTKYLDFSSILDYATSIGTEYVHYDFLHEVENAAEIAAGSVKGWHTSNNYYVADAVGPYLRIESFTTKLADATGDWLPDTTIQVTAGVIPLYLDGINPITMGTLYMKFTWLEDGELQTSYAELVRGTAIDAFHFGYTFEFGVSVPTYLRTNDILFSPITTVNRESSMEQGIVIAEIAFTTSLIPSGYSQYASLKGYCDMMGYEVHELGTMLAPIEIPITIEVNGNIYGNYKDPSETITVTLKHYYDTPTSNTEVISGLGNFFEITLPEACSWFVMGAPAIGEIETLPVASIEQDITDTKKNIDYTSVLLYKTKGLRVGEVGQPDTELERFDFTTEDSVSDPVEFSGPKSHNFSSTWNDHGKVRISGMDLQPFSISGIIPKGNVGGFGG